MSGTSCAMKPADKMRTRILDTALSLLAAGGGEAVSTRDVTSALNIQAPTLYRIFGDKQGLLDAAAAYGFATHLAQWQGWQPGIPLIDQIRQGWDMHIKWGVENPYLYSIAYGQARPGVNSQAAQEIDAILRTLAEQAASDGLLRVPVTHAVHMLRAVGTGVVFTLIAMPEGSRDERLSERSLEAVLSAILVEKATPETGTHSGAAIHLKANLATATGFTVNERALFGEWLDRLAGA